MEEFTQALVALIAREDDVWGLLLIALSAGIEYLLPPFPGDTITLLAAVLITAYAWSFWAVFGAVMLGSVAGSMATFYIGGWLRKRRLAAAGQAADDGGANGDGEEDGDERALLDRLVAGFERHGAAYLVINRFLPGVRALFFVAAGMADMRPAAVLVYSAISAAMWNLLVIAVGSALGASLDTLTLWTQRYAQIAWVILAAALGFFALRHYLRLRMRRRRRRRRTDR